MGFLGNIGAWFSRRRATKKQLKKSAAAAPLREFIYLDEVSLLSLLSSQKGEVTEGTSQAVAEGTTAELSSKIGAASPVVAAELASRFQTTNSSTLQTSRKASVQSWFKEFHTIPGLRLVQPTLGVNAVAEAAELHQVSDRSVVLPVSELSRGSLVEFRVRLSADPVFRLGALMSEFSGMADDYPELFAGNASPANFHQAQLVNKVLNRLLAGLIPVRGAVLDYSVVRLEGVEHVVHRDAITGLSLEAEALEIVGVTEHLAYWKDIRRVLFSDAEFTVLCRVARSGLQSSWTPVKLTDVFRDVAPGLADQLSAVGRAPLAARIESTPSSQTAEAQLGVALELYSVLRREVIGGKTPTKAQEKRIGSTIAVLSGHANSATAQREAFRSLEQMLEDLTGISLEAEQAILLRERSRDGSRLPLFPALAPEPAVAASAIPEPGDDGARLLDVEIVAIYW